MMPKTIEDPENLQIGNVIDAHVIGEKIVTITIEDHNVQVELENDYALIFKLGSGEFHVLAPIPD